MNWHEQTEMQFRKQLFGLHLHQKVVDSAYSFSDNLNETCHFLDLLLKKCY